MPFEVSGHVTPKPYPKSRAGRRVVPLPSMVSDLLKRHRDEYGTGPAGEVFTNEAGTPLRRTLFRARIWRPALVRAGLLGAVAEEGEKFRATWPTTTGDMSEVFSTAVQAVKAIARHGEGGLRFHDLRHSYASWLITSGVPGSRRTAGDGTRAPNNHAGDLRPRPGGSQERVLDAFAA